MFELRSEVRVGDIVNASFEAFVFVECRHSRSACTEVAMVVGAVKDIGDTRGRRYCTKKTSHIVVSGLREEMRSRI